MIVNSPGSVFALCKYDGYIEEENYDDFCNDNDNNDVIQILRSQHDFILRRTSTYLQTLDGVSLRFQILSYFIH